MYYLSLISSVFLFCLLRKNKGRRTEMERTSRQDLFPFFLLHPSFQSLIDAREEMMQRLSHFSKYTE